jgi:hypothetical protein
MFKMMRLLNLFSFLVIGLTLGCGGSNSRISIEETPVKGSVTVDGKALAEGEIYFIVSGYAPNIIPIANGEYAGKAKVGSNRIEIRSWKEGPPLSTDTTKQPTKVNTIPSDYNDSSKLTAEVQSKGENNFKFNAP